MFPETAETVRKRRALLGSAATGFSTLRCEFFVWDVATKALVPAPRLEIFRFDAESKKLVPLYRVE